MNHIKQFFKEKGLYLFCLAMVFAATAAGILALRSIVGNVDAAGHSHRQTRPGCAQADDSAHHRTDG